MSVKHYRKGVKKRREERLRLLKAKQRRSNPISFREGGNVPSQPSFPRSRTGGRASSTLMFKMICAMLLFTTVLMVMNTDHPQLREAKTFIRDVMTLDFNVEGVMALYEQKVGSQLGFLPQFIAKDDNSHPHSSDYVLPVSGARIVSGFNQDQQGIVLETGTTLPVEVIKEGWVTYVGEKDGLGQVVIIDHGQGEESWYGQLQEIKVQLYDWVKQGEVIGTTSVQEGSQEGVLYFALRRDAVFIDPLDVIPFE
ncbi:stage IV sporulation protein FA [Caldalkalibacillus uzonensis]|uniref:Stage IV sporulation protein FA n=1 Tax=Caldalkalibacillus uzonensis TaxID=353224 RepID=A0ABU0CTS6_9BACI|nr:peptidoglycan DD-metalloendopeptidase family protein [Caldalkalibacillus uzonensis]MDQ0339498.1 stage IV sporulation protein FA [Caldalkalibacillus uzonensis]